MAAKNLCRHKRTNIYNNILIYIPYIFSTFKNGHLFWITEVGILVVDGEGMKTGSASSGSTSMARLEALEEVDGCRDAKRAGLSAFVFSSYNSL
jgi:hypothetical protein